MTASWRAPATALAVSLLTCAQLMAATPSPRVLDDFSDPGVWRLAASDDVKARVYRDSGSGRNALCLEYDFGRVAGYAAVRRPLWIDYDGNYEFTLDIRGNAPPAGLQFKLADASGENVWWVNRPEQQIPADWRQLRFKKRDIAFAWGPQADRELKHSATLELVIARGDQGSKGTVCFAGLGLRDLAPESPARHAVIEASSSLVPGAASHVLDGDRTTLWQSDPAAGRRQTLTIDFQRPRELSGLILHWANNRHASRYDVALSDDGSQWRTVRRVTRGQGRRDPHPVGKQETRYLRLDFLDGPADGYALAEIEITDTQAGATANGFIQDIAAEAPRGHFPRGFSGEQAYWTVVGVDGGSAQALVSEDGALDIGARFGSVEPFLVLDGKVLTWADVQPEQSLAGGYLPMPRVEWRRPDVALQLSAFASGGPGHSQLVGEYRLENKTQRPQAATLALAIRPLQVNPPTQSLNIAGGVAPIHSLEWTGKELVINNEPRVLPLHAPDHVVLAHFDEGQPPELLSRASVLEGKGRINDETGLASALLVYRVQLAPGETRRIALLAPLEGPPHPPQGEPSQWLDQQRESVAAEWREKLNRVAVALPPQSAYLADSLRTALASILISRAGPALRPGTRAYARSWIRDGAMMADALLRTGHAHVVRRYAEWFSRNRFTNGKVPCCVDGRGADPVAENDSHGEFIHLVSEYYRYAPDADWVRGMWPGIASAARYMDMLRLSERTAANRAPERRRYFGLMPPSISHEGYSDRPAYSYWDNFWTLAGYEGVVQLSAALDRKDMDYLRQRDEFRGDLLASLQASIAAHNIDYIPGSADRGDFDATSTTIALSLPGATDRLPEPQLRQTFERYWQEVAARENGAPWDAYTPYEFRNVGAFVRLGWRERAAKLLDVLMTGRRPAAWNGWAEVVGRKAREPRFIGDMPHAWVASDFMRALLDIFAYERATDDALVLGAGVRDAWMTGNGAGIKNLDTPYGKLSYTLRRESGTLILDIEAGMTPPRGGLVFRWPYSGTPGAVSVNGEPGTWHAGNELVIRSLPTRISIRTDR